MIEAERLLTNKLTLYKCEYLSAKIMRREGLAELQKRQNFVALLQKEHSGNETEWSSLRLRKSSGRA